MLTKDVRNNQMIRRVDVLVWRRSGAREASVFTPTAKSVSGTGKTYSMGKIKLEQIYLINKAVNSLYF